MASEFEVKGLAELNAALQALPEKLAANALRGALRAGQKVFLKSAQAGVPVRSGELRKSLRISTSRKGGVVRALLKAGNKAAPYAHLVEFGTAAHVIAAQPGHTLAIGYAKVHHPGAKKKPFMRPAFDANTEAAVQAVAVYLERRIERENLNAADPNADA